MISRTALAAAATVAALGVGAGVAYAASAPSPDPAPSTTAATATAGPVLSKNLRFSREEERMARDLYTALAETYDNARPMSMIAVSEQRHFDAIGTLLTRYGVADPSAGLAAGSYAFPELQALYDQWYADGSAGLRAAQQVGIELERRDLADLRAMLKQTRRPDVRRVFSALATGSEHHLAAFTRAAGGSASTSGSMMGGWGGMTDRPGGPMGRGNGPMSDRGWAGPMMGGTRDACPWADGDE